AGAQGEYGKFREKLSGLRARLNTWHRESSDLHSQRESVSRDLAVLEERRRALGASYADLSAEQERTAGEERRRRERLAEDEQGAPRLQAELEEARSQLTGAQTNLQDRQAERAAAEEQLTAARNAATSLHAQKAETQARLDELGARLEIQKQKLESVQRA